MRALLLAAPLALALAGCGGSVTPSSDAASSPPAKPKPSRTASPKPTHTEKPTSNVKDCHDGTCLLKVKGPKTIPLNKKKFHYAKVKVTEVTSSHLGYQVPYSNGGGATSSLSPGGSGAFGFRDRPSIEIRLVSVEHGTALLSLKAQHHM